jgi:hypothetical protein
MTVRSKPAEPSALEPTEIREAVAKAALRTLRRQGCARTSFDDIIASAKEVKRASAYAAFPGGLPTLWRYLNDRTARRIEETAHAAVSRIEADQKVGLVDALEAGFSAVIDSFAADAMMKALTPSDPEVVTSYLFSEKPGSVRAISAKLVADCWRLRSRSRSGNDQVRRAADELVFWVIAAWIKGFPELRRAEDLDLRPLIDQFITSTSAATMTTSDGGKPPQTPGTPMEVAFRAAMMASR